MIADAVADQIRARLAEFEATASAGELLDAARAVRALPVYDDIGGALTARDLAGLRQLRESLRAVFQAGSAAEAAALLNPMLRHAVPQLVTSGDGVKLQIAPQARGLAALTARLPAALAEHVAERGAGRLGTCAAPPCQCAFVDRTRARTRRFCCTACNDRAAALLYRQRKRATAG